MTEALGTTEGSLAGRIVALFTPVFVIAASWLADLVAKVIPGAGLDQTQIVVFMVAAATSALIAAWKSGCRAGSNTNC